LLKRYFTVCDVVDLFCFGRQTWLFLGDLLPLTDVCLSVVQERKFMEHQQETMEKAMKREADKHREKTAILERHSLELRHQLLRGNHLHPSLAHDSRHASKWRSVVDL